MSAQMQILKGLEQGSDLWKEVRGKYLCASEAPIMMGASPYMTRDELLQIKTGISEQEVSRWMEIIFEQGHETEVKARPIAEERMGDDLFALVGVRTVAALALLASFDGITEPLYDLHWEHKQFNQELYEIVRARGELPPKIFWQLEHQLAVNGNDKCIFAVSDGSETNYAEMEYHFRPERREQLIEGWKIFLQDMQNYQYEPVPVKPAGEVMKDLPALVVEITGGVKSSNLVAYRSTALKYIQDIKTDLQTDEDFATAENAVKFLEGKEKELVIVERQIIGQVASIDEITRTITELKAAMRNKRLALDKLIKSEKESRRAEIVLKVKNAWGIHFQEINELLRPAALPQIPVDFAGAIKGKRTIESLRAAANAELTRARIEANRWQNHITANLQALRDLGKDHMFLFNDLQALVVKDKDALEAIAKQRIAEHKAAEDRRIQAEAERIAAVKERERLTAEAEAKAKADADAEAERLRAQEALQPVATPTAPAATPAQTIGAASPTQADLAGRAYATTPIHRNADPKPVPPPAGVENVRSTYSRLCPPTDRQILLTLSREFRVDVLDVIEWLKGLDLDGEIELAAAQA